MNSCPAFKGLYIARHDRIVDLIAKELHRNMEQLTKLHTHKTVQTDWFSLSNSTLERVIKSSPNTPDVVMINETTRTVIILEIGCSFDSYMDICFSSKILKYQPLAEAIGVSGYNCKTIALIFGSLGHVHKMCVRGLQLAGLTKMRAKQLVKFCSVSAIIGSYHIWKRRCHLYP